MKQKIYKDNLILKFTNTKLFLKKYIIGPDYINVIFTFLFINICELFFIIYVSILLSFYWLFVIINLILVDYFLLKTCFSDPGIIIRPVI